MATIAPPAPASAKFPAAAIEAYLRAELIVAIQADAAIKGISLPTAPAEMAKASVPIDSLVVVSILCAVEPIVGPGMINGFLI